MGVPFKYNLCLFQKEVGRDPDDTSKQDEFTLFTAIRRMLLDVMWA